jgi:hypothetical protein
MVGGSDEREALKSQESATTIPHTHSLSLPGIFDNCNYFSHNDSNNVRRSNLHKQFFSRLILSHRFLLQKAARLGEPAATNQTYMKPVFKMHIGIHSPIHCMIQNRRHGDGKGGQKPTKPSHSV